MSSGQAPRALKSILKNSSREATRYNEMDNEQNESLISWFYFKFLKKIFFTFVKKARFCNIKRSSKDQLGHALLFFVALI